MHTTDRRQQKQPEYPEFLHDARLDGSRDTYQGLRSFGQGMAVETLAKKLGISESTAHRHIRKLKALGCAQGQDPGWPPADQLLLVSHPGLVGRSRAG